MWYGQGFKWAVTYYSAHHFLKKTILGFAGGHGVWVCVCFGHHLLLGTEPAREPYSSTQAVLITAQPDRNPHLLLYFFFLTIKTNLLQQPSITEWCPSPLICPSGWPDSKGRRMPPTESATPASQSCAAPSVQQLNQPCVLQIPSLRLVFGLKKKKWHYLDCQEVMLLAQISDKYFHIL